MTNISTVIGWKFNHQAGMCTKDGIITEFPGGIPSQADQDAWTAEYEAYCASVDYQRQRAVTYWPLADQLDAIYWDKKHGTNVWEQHIDAVKNTYPKP